MGVFDEVLRHFIMVPMPARDIVLRSVHDARLQRAVDLGVGDRGRGGAQRFTRLTMIGSADPISRPLRSATLFNGLV